MLHELSVAFPSFHVRFSADGPSLPMSSFTVITQHRPCRVGSVGVGLVWARLACVFAVDAVAPALLVVPASGLLVADIRGAVPECDEEWSASSSASNSRRSNKTLGASSEFLSSTCTAVNESNSYRHLSHEQQISCMMILRSMHKYAAREKAVPMKRGVRYRSDCAY